jgi:preprotein translocase SecE subunit
MADQQVAESKPSFISTITTPIRETVRETTGELRKVHWPTRPVVQNLTTIVLGVTITMGILLGVIDFLLEQLFFGLLRPEPSLISIAVLVVVVLAVIILVLFASRERR